MNFVILYGTESGNAEMAADDVSQAILDLGDTSAVVSMEDFDVIALPRVEHLIVITSTYGEGGLPETAVPFHKALLDQRPDLSTLAFSAFGLGDSSYETYNNGVDTITATLQELGAAQRGSTGRHDASAGTDPSDEAVAWITSLMAPV